MAQDVALQKNHPLCAAYGPWALVTGASDGIGRAFAIELAQKGFSLVAFQGVPRAANYAATKAYVQALAEGLSLELKGRCVDVLAFAPGPVVSGFGARSGMAIAKGQTPEEVARALRALGRHTTLRPGFLAKALAPLPRPFRVRVRVMGKVMAGMTGA